MTSNIFYHLSYCGHLKGIYATKQAGKVYTKAMPSLLASFQVQKNTALNLVHLLDHCKSLPSPEQLLRKGDQPPGVGEVVNSLRFV